MNWNTRAIRRKRSFLNVFYLGVCILLIGHNCRCDDYKLVRCFSQFTGEHRIAVTLAIVTSDPNYDKEVNIRVFLKRADGESELVKGKRQRMSKVRSEYAQSLGGDLFSAHVIVYYRSGDDREETIEPKIDPITGNKYTPNGIAVQEAGDYRITFHTLERSNESPIAEYEFSVLGPSFMNSNIIVIDQ